MITTSAQKRPILLLTIITASLIISVPSVAFAEEITVSLPVGSGAPGCETTDKCYIPSMVTVRLGDKVVWSNDDTAAHTVTSGSPTDGPDGNFDSSLFMAGTTFSHTFDKAGTYPYFCMVHPWMKGSVMISAAASAGTQSPTSSNTMSSAKSMKVSGTELMIGYEMTTGKVISVSPDTDASSLIVGISASDAGTITLELPRSVIDAKIGNMDDDLFVLIDGEEVSFEESLTKTSRELMVSFPEGAEEIEIIGTFVIPEFGAIAAMILAVAIVSIIAISAKSKLSIMPRL